MIKKGADVNSRNNRCWYQWSALHVAAVEGNFDVVDVLIKSGADVNMLDWDQWTPLHYAAYQGMPRHALVAKKLLDAGADVYEETWNGRTALTIAKSYGNEHVADVISQFERDHAVKLGMRRRKNNLDRDGIRKDRDRFLDQLSAHAC